MKKNIYILFTIACSMLFVSCEKIVDLDLRTIDPRLVIDATMQEGNPCIVYLNLTQDYYNNEKSPTVSGGIITLSDDTGNTETLVEIVPGVYTSQEMIGMSNETYTLNVSVKGKTYTAKSTLMETVPIDSLYTYNIEIGKEHFYSPAIIFQDPVGAENYYYSKVFVNGRRLSTVYLSNDEYKNGKIMNDVLFYDRADNNDDDLEIGDEIKVEMRTIDKGAYDYLLSMSYSVAAGGATNPISNFSGGVLGWFSAYGLSTREMVIAEDNIFTKTAK